SLKSNHRSITVTSTDGSSPWFTKVTSTQCCANPHVVNSVTSMRGPPEGMSTAELHPESINVKATTHTTQLPTRSIMSIALSQPLISSSRIGHVFPMVTRCTTSTSSTRYHDVLTRTRNCV